MNCFVTWPSPGDDMVAFSQEKINKSPDVTAGCLHTALLTAVFWRCYWDRRVPYQHEFNQSHIWIDQIGCLGSIADLKNVQPSTTKVHFWHNFRKSQIRKTIYMYMYCTWFCSIIIGEHWISERGPNPRWRSLGIAILVLKSAKRVPFYSMA